MLLEIMPKIRGEIRQNTVLAKMNWFSVGGEAEFLFRPKDTEDLAYFIKNKPKNMPITVLGVGSNLLVRDGGIKGVVVRLGRGFTDIEFLDGNLNIGAGNLNYNVADWCKNHAITGLEFLVGIPGTIGGSIMMNAGAYGGDVASRLIEAEAIDEYGDIHILSANDIGFLYRGNSLAPGYIFTKGIFAVEKGNQEEIAAKMADINNKREETQPIRSKTSGSTFKNPPGNKRAWQLIDEAGCRGLKIGDACVSDKHCNFLINLGNATASDIEKLGEEIRKRVYAKAGIMLEWEIKIIGEF